MATRQAYLLWATLAGGGYGLLLGLMTGFPFPSGLGLGMLFGWLCGYAHTISRVRRGERLKRPAALRFSPSAQSGRTHF